MIKNTPKIDKVCRNKKQYFEKKLQEVIFGVNGSKNEYFNLIEPLSDSLSTDEQDELLAYQYGRRVSVILVLYFDNHGIRQPFDRCV